LVPVVLCIFAEKNGIGSAGAEFEK